MKDGLADGREREFDTMMVGLGPKGLRLWRELQILNAPRPGEDPRVVERRRRKRQRATFARLMASMIELGYIPAPATGGPAQRREARRQALEAAQRAKVAEAARQREEVRAARWKADEERIAARRAATQARREQEREPFEGQCQGFNSRGTRCRYEAVADGRCLLHPLRQE